jgi:2-polyprenyl-6-methoxyphenol hydroxylase-like FAD-dependent oxidoreductase
MKAEATALIEEGGRVAGLRAATGQGDLLVRADLVVGADGRRSTVREKAGLESTNLGAPMDVLWMRLSRHPSSPGRTLGRVDPGKISVILNREDYWQCAYVIPKGGFDRIRQSGLTAFRNEIVRLAPYLSDRIDELADWSDIKLLTVAVDRLRVWHRPGLLCIGDAANAMSPIGGWG